VSETFLTYAIANVVIGLAVVAHHDYAQWQNREIPRAPSPAMTMPWLPLTVGYDNSCNPNWNKYYPPAVKLDDNFHDALYNGVVTLYYYNCGIRQEKNVTSNYRFRSDDVGFSTFKNSDGKKAAGAGYIIEDNIVKAGETRFKSICGWTSEDRACPDLKSEVAAEWRKGTFA